MNTAWAVVGKVRWSRARRCWRVEADSTKLGMEPDATSFVVREPRVRDQLRDGWLSSFRWERMGRHRVITSATLHPANVLNPERELRDVPMTFHEVMARRWAKEVALQNVARRRGLRLGEDEEAPVDGGDEP